MLIGSILDDDSASGVPIAMKMSRRLHDESRGRRSGNLIFLGVGASMFAAALATMFLF